MKSVLYNGVQALIPEQDETLMKAAKAIGAGILFERTRRITGYLSPLERFNDAKSAEERDRLKHELL